MLDCCNNTRGRAGTAGKLEGLEWRQEKMKAGKQRIAAHSLWRVEAELSSPSLPAAASSENHPHPSRLRIPATEHILCKQQLPQGSYSFRDSRRLYCPPQNPLSSAPGLNVLGTLPVLSNPLCPQIHALCSRHFADYLILTITL